MSFLMPSCREATERLTDLGEGGLGPLERLALRVHLRLCPPCQAFLASLEDAARLCREAWDEDPAEPCAEQALARALDALREGRAPSGPQHHPEPEAWAALDPGGDPWLALLLRLHLGQCEACRAAGDPAWEPLRPAEGALPEALAPFLPPPSRWTWHRRGLGGLRLARVAGNDRSGGVLYLACLPGGARVPAHAHPGTEASVLLRGRLQDGPAHLAPGDWICHGGGDQHAPLADPGEACWSLIHVTRPVRFLGWRRILS